MKLNFLNKAPTTFSNVVHPSGYMFENKRMVVPKKSNEEPYYKDINLKEMWLHLNQVAINEVQWVYDKTSDNEGLAINEQIFLDLYNKYGFAEIGKYLPRREGFYKEGFNISEYKERRDLYDHLLGPFHQYNYKYNNSNKKIFDLITDISILQLDIRKEAIEIQTEAYLSVGIDLNNEVLQLVPNNLMSAFILYSLQTNLGEITECKNCHHSFINNAQGKTAIYCSNKCRQSEYRNIRFKKSADLAGLTLIEDGNTYKKRIYRFNKCGHEQEMTTRDVRNKQIKCKICS